MAIVSIIVPVYNAEKYLRSCLDSILAQTFTDFEAVLVDDGSTDLSGAICDEYAAIDIRFMVIHKKNEGVAKARITAFEHSKGELITFIDADDYVDPDYLEILSKPILRQDADMVSCNYYDVNAINHQQKATTKVLHGTFTGISLQKFIANLFLFDKSCNGFGMTPFLCTKMVKRKFVAKGLEDGVGMWFGEDQIAVFSMLNEISKLRLLSERLYYYVHYKEQTTQRYDASLWDSLIRMFESYKRLDTRGISSKGLRIRTWIYINRTICKKMIPSGVSMNVFVNHLSKVLVQPYIKEFFKKSSIGIGWKDEIGYMLLKLGWLRLFYVLFLAWHARKMSK